ncbi:MAG: L-arabinose isomerase [Oscillospiraceae bacterium]|nr:L-arabinose isomerase [Oscillospiraceae bacterium]
MSELFKLSGCEFWFITGSQFLYGEETLEQVRKNSEIIVNSLNNTGLPCAVIFKGVMKTAEEITGLMNLANYDNSCAGIITFCHTFSPSKMWINGFGLLQKPCLHLHTQFNRNIPDADIDMDYMNLHQSAHGDREHGFIAARMGVSRKIVAGYWQDGEVHNEITAFMRAAAGFKAGRELKVMRFGDNMREVAVTEGDKVEAQKKFGWQVNTHPVGELAERIRGIPEARVDALMDEYSRKYIINTENTESIREQARMEAAMKELLEENHCCAYTNTFEDLYGMEQLPGLASQRLMEAGYGYGGEGDWKTSALVYIMKVMASGLNTGTSFMEDYTYDLTKGSELILGAHMLEVCPTIADSSKSKPKIETHILGIGGKSPPARLVFEGKAGKALNVSLIDMGGRMRLIAQEVECVKPVYEMPKLPVARVMWKPLPDFKTAVSAWLLAGGAHHTVLSYGVTAEIMRDYARMAGLEFVHLSADTNLMKLEQELALSDMIWRLKCLNG